MSRYIDVDKAIKALLDALYDYENKTEKQFLDNPKLDICSWFEHRIFVQDMSDIDRQTILNMDTANVRPNVRGVWDVNEHLLRYAPFHECKQCGEQMYITHDNFCPNCGADMRKGENNG